MASIDDLKNLLKIHYRNLQMLEQKKAKFGDLHTPVHIINQIDDEKREIEELERKIKELESQSKTSPSASYEASQTFFNLSTKFDKPNTSSLPVINTEKTSSNIINIDRNPINFTPQFDYDDEIKRAEINLKLRNLLQQGISGFIRELESFDKQNPLEWTRDSILDWEENREKQDIREQRLQRLKQKIYEYLTDSISTTEADRFLKNCSFLGGNSLDISKAKAFLTVLSEVIANGEVEISPSRRRRRRR